MKKLYGLIGEKLSHSLSAGIHSYFGDYEYELIELAPDELDGFIKSRDYRGINVTIPYKEAVIKHLDVLSETARNIGAVNTIVNRNGKLYGYNTDCRGLEYMFKRSGATFEGKNVLILGSGGTSKTARYAAERAKAGSIKIVSRTKTKNTITYGEALKARETDMIINTTPVGMYPDIGGAIIDISAFPKLSFAADVVYNPLRTAFIQSAQERGIGFSGGLSMLFAQAMKASELFTGKSVSESALEDAINETYKNNLNVVITGMPSSGKTTVARHLGKSLGREVVDTDEQIILNENMPITDIFAQKGEAYFRKVESEVVMRVCSMRGVVIATGGGVVLSRENMQKLKSGAAVFFLNRRPELLTPTRERPLSSSPGEISELYHKRFGTYLSTCDYVVENNLGYEQASQKIKEIFDEITCH